MYICFHCVSGFITFHPKLAIVPCEKKTVECADNHLRGVMSVLNCCAAVMARLHSHLSGLSSECQHITSVTTVNTL